MSKIKKIAIGLLFILLCLAFLVYGAKAQEARVMVIDGVTYRLFNEAEMRDLLIKLKERELCTASLTALEEKFGAYASACEDLKTTLEKQLDTTTKKLEGERNFWKSQFDAERQTTLRLEAIFRSCGGRFLGLFRICRL